MRVQVDVTRSKYKRPAELKRVLAQLGLAEAACASALSRGGIVPAEQVEEVCALETDGPIRNPIFVDQQWKRDSSFFSKQTRIIPVSQPYGCQGGARCLEISLVFAQLRDMLAAENSAVVP